MIWIFDFAFELNIFQKKLKKTLDNKYITGNIYRKHANGSKIWQQFCYGFVDFKLRDKSFLGYTNWFSPNEYEKNDEVILEYFK